jgi:hypothetical protein
VTTVIGFFAVAAAVSVVVAIMGKCPLWVPVLCLTIVELLRILPLGR